jgi:GNAT superfamily N-acetyltransferase
MNLQYRPIPLDQCAKIRDIDASQTIQRAWREVDGNRVLIDINYHDPDFPNGYENHLAALENTIKSGGFAIGAFDQDKLVGFSTVNPDYFGHNIKYLLLDQIFISNHCRNKGIGKKLFSLSAKYALSRGADKLYICAGSAEETIAFYTALGCKEAVERDEALYQADPRDYQLEFDLLR